MISFSANHNLQVGDELSTLGEQVAVADSFEVWERSFSLDNTWGRQIKVAEAAIRISGWFISTNTYNPTGLVCFLPDRFKGCAILKVRITSIGNRSVRAVPIDYISADVPIDTYQTGQMANVLLAKVGLYSGIKREV